MARGKGRAKQSAGTARMNRSRGKVRNGVRLLRAGSGEANPELDRARQRARRQRADPIEESPAARDVSREQADEE